MTLEPTEEEIRYRHRQSLDRQVTALAGEPAEPYSTHDDGVPLWIARALSLVDSSLRSVEGRDAVRRQTGGNAPELVQGLLDQIGALWDRVPSEPDPRDAGGEALKYGPLHMAERLAASEAEGVKLREVVEAARAYLEEHDNPAKDYLLRVRQRERLRDALREVKP